MTDTAAIAAQPVGDGADRPYRILVSTGEVSGDLQGSLLIAALFRQAQVRGIDLEVVALGGDRMAQAGAKLLGNTTHIGSIGLVEALPYILPTWQLQRQAKQALRKLELDLTVLIDYIGGNVTIGSFVRQVFPQIPILYYIAPQEWVWSLGAKNTAQVISLSDYILAIFPEEARYYEAKGGQVIWVGHPLVDRVQQAPARATARQTLEIADDAVAIALLPASRRQELKYLMPVMFEAAQTIQAQIPQAHFWIPLSLEIYRPALEQAIQDYGLNATIVAGNAQTVIAAADLAITKSGTVNLEIALQKVPQVVLYRVGKVTAWIAQHILKFSIPFMSPPNLVQMRAIVPEFLQDQATPENLAREALDLLLNAERRQKMLADYEQMRQALGETGVCDRAANAILDRLPKPQA